MSSFFRGLESIAGVVLVLVVVVVGVFLVWVWFSGFVGRGVSSVGVPVEVLKIEGGYVTNVGDGVVVFLWVFNAGGDVVLPRTVYVYRAGSRDVVCFADRLPWAIDPGPPPQYLHVWMPVGTVGEYPNGVVAGCGEAVAPGVLYEVRLVTARGAEVSVVLAAS